MNAIDIEKIIAESEEELSAQFKALEKIAYSNQ